MRAGPSASMSGCSLPGPARCAGNSATWPRCTRVMASRRGDGGRWPSWTPRPSWSGRVASPRSSAALSRRRIAARRPTPNGDLQFLAAGPSALAPMVHYATSWQPGSEQAAVRRLRARLQLDDHGRAVGAGAGLLSHRHVPRRPAGNESRTANHEAVSLGIWMSTRVMCWLSYVLYVHGEPAVGTTHSTPISSRPWYRTSETGMVTVFWTVPAAFGW